MEQLHPSSETLSVAITGSGGSGVVTAGQILLQAVANAGFYGLMTRSAGPQIRGGESAIMLRIGGRQVECLDDQFDLLLALDWLNVSRFVEEIPLVSTSIIVCDPEAGEIPESISSYGARIMHLPLTEMAKALEGGRTNMVGLGVLADLLGIPEDTMLEAGQQALRSKGSAIVQSSDNAIRAGFLYAKPMRLAQMLPPLVDRRSRRRRARARPVSRGRHRRCRLPRAASSG